MMFLIPYPIPEPERGVLCAAGAFCIETAGLFGRDSLEHQRSRATLDMVIGTIKQRHGVECDRPQPLGA